MTNKRAACCGCASARGSRVARPSTPSRPGSPICSARSVSPRASRYRSSTDPTPIAVTFSVVACSADGQQCGVAVASKFFAVGAVVPAAQGAVGAMATQSVAHRTHRPYGLSLLRSRLSAAATLAALLDADEGRNDRQIAVVDALAGAATFTGSACTPHAGGCSGDGYAIQGNTLAGPAVIEQMEQAYLACGPQTGLARRLYAALAAGDAHGGDRRGRQSASLLVVDAAYGPGPGGDIHLDLRVDDHRDPVSELGRLLELGELYLGPPDPG